MMATASTVETPAASPGVETARCVTRAATTVALAETAAVDRIVVEVAAGSPEEGAADVRVQTGASARVVHIWGAASRSLEFYPALVGQSFAVAVDPVARPDDLQDGLPDDLPDALACVRRVTLMHKGAVVSEVAP
jgi:hypothetical protein